MLKFVHFCSAKATKQTDSNTFPLKSEMALDLKLNQRPQQPSKTFTPCIDAHLTSILPRTASVHLTLFLPHAPGHITPCKPLFKIF